MSREYTAQLKAILTDPRNQWPAFVRKAAGMSRTAFRKLDVDWEVFNAKDYLFTHDTIVASVATEADGYTIKPACEELVNANGNAWTNAVLLSCYKTFIGGENYSEHLQVPSLSKGRILDAIIREAEHRGEKIYVVDILVATSRRHKTLCERIERGELKTMSMGATAKMVQCSVCGRVFDTVKGDTLCDHLTHHLKEKVNYRGKEKYCAELCGAMDPKTGEYLKDSCVFIEASWVEQPAFEGAVTNYLVETPEVRTARIERRELENAFAASLVPSLRVADRTDSIAMEVLRKELEEERVEADARAILLRTRL